MVKRRLTSIASSEWDLPESLSIEIEKLKKKNLRKIKSTEQIKQICHEVIGAIDTLLLVHVNEDTIEKRKVKKERDTPISYDDSACWNNGAKIREDWSTDRWTKKTPHGWVYYNEDKSLLGTIYEWKEEWQYEVFIRREVAENPHGATILIREMKKKLEEILPKK
jgi:hypothetical protein